MHRRYAGFREGGRVDSCLTYTTEYFSLYERSGILIQNPFRSPKSIVELGRENALCLISRHWFVGLMLVMILLLLLTLT